MDGLLIAITTMGGLGFIFAGALAIADKKLRVWEDPKIGEINDVLPGANCGGCGKAGCYDFAVNVAAGKAPVTGCPVGGEETASAVALIMGVDGGGAVKMLPRVMCQGGNKEAMSKMTEYHGPLSCSAMDLVSGGDKLCFYGCLGGGDCVVACPFNAMYMSDNGLPVVIEDLCTGCGNCARACPRNIIHMHPSDREVFVFCSSHDDPITAKQVCKVSCLGCAICSKKSDGGVNMESFLAVIDYDKFDESKIPFEKCPTKVIRKLTVEAPDPSVN